MYRGGKVRGERAFGYPDGSPPELADRPEQLVPIRLEFDVEHHKMRDTFLWNLNDSVEDYSLLPSYHSVIVKSIQEQLSDFKAHMVDVDWKSQSSAHRDGPLG
ncbi:hypothetical protein EDD15DRAFT_2196117 [Pisolithus albus]|nr:hypothetical protein EDD15DRAFT_2196117 [Pisolithus albus]